MGIRNAARKLRRVGISEQVKLRLEGKTIYPHVHPRKLLRAGIRSRDGPYSPPVGENASYCKARGFAPAGGVWIDKQVIPEFVLADGTRL